MKNFVIIIVVAEEKCMHEKTSKLHERRRKKNTLLQKSAYITFIVNVDEAHDIVDDWRVYMYVHVHGHH